MLPDTTGGAPPMLAAVSEAYVRPDGSESFTQRVCALSPEFCNVIVYTMGSLECRPSLLDVFVRLITGPTNATSHDAVCIGHEWPFSSVKLRNATFRKYGTGVR